MRRKAIDFRKPARRRWFLERRVQWVPCLLGLLLLLLFFSDHDRDPRSASIAVQTYQNFAVSIPQILNATEEMLNANSVTRQLVDQISLARAYLVIAKESNNLQFAGDLSIQIRNSQALLSTVAIRESPLTFEESQTVIRNMAILLYQAQDLHYDTATMLMKMKGQLHSLQEKSKLESDKSTKFGQIAAEELPKSLYCFGIRLTMEWFAQPRRIQHSAKLSDNSLQHFCMFSDNILAASVVVNSTAANAKNPNRLVFHIITDEVNYIPMMAWFSMTTFGGAAIDIQKLEEYKSHNYYIPELFPGLRRIVFLDDDVVVQKDLSELFLIDLNGKVMGAVESCRETWNKYLHFDPDACGWAFGMNVIDLVEWRKRNVTGSYHYWKEMNADHMSPGLLVFYGLVQRLDPKWHVLGLGYRNVDLLLISEGAVLHYNGNMKPWLKSGMEKYKGLWEKYVDYYHPLLQRCFVH